MCSVARVLFALDSPVTFKLLMVMSSGEPSATEVIGKVRQASHVY